MRNSFCHVEFVETSNEKIFCDWTDSSLHYRSALNDNEVHYLLRTS